MPDSTLPPLLTWDTIVILTWFSSGVLLELLLQWWQQQRQSHQPAKIRFHTITIILLLLCYWYNFLTLIWPTTVLPELLLPVMIIASVIIIILLVIQTWVSARWHKLLTLWSMLLTILLQLTLFMQPTPWSLPLGLQLVLTGMIITYSLVQLRSVLTWLKQ